MFFKLILYIQIIDFKNLIKLNDEISCKHLIA